MYVLLINARNIVGLNAYQYLLKPIFFRFDPEFVHEKMTERGKFLGKFGATRAFTSFAFNFEDLLIALISIE